MTSLVELDLADDGVAVVTLADPDRRNALSKQLSDDLAAAVDDAVAAGLTTPEEFDRGIADLRRTAGEGGTFHYTFFKGTAVNPADSHEPPDGAPPH